MVSFNSSAVQQCAEIDNLEDWQKSNARRAYTLGQPHNLSYTLIAIAMTESRLGQWKLNYKSDDFGITQINIETASNELGVTNYYERIELAQKLVSDNDLAFILAIRVLHFFEHRGWSDMIRSYNEGSRWKRDERSRKKTDDYLTTVKRYVKMFQTCDSWR